MEAREVDRRTPTMSSKEEWYGDSVQTVEKFIDIELINNAVAKLQANSAEATDDMMTRLDWTSACDELLQFYRTKVHPEVDLEAGINSWRADSMLRLLPGQKSLLLLSRRRRRQRHSR